MQDNAFTLTQNTDTTKAGCLEIDDHNLTTLLCADGDSALQQSTTGIEIYVTKSGIYHLSRLVKPQEFGRIPSKSSFSRLSRHFRQTIPIVKKRLVRETSMTLSTNCVVLRSETLSKWYLVNNFNAARA